MQLYQFERIYSQMGNEFGKIRKEEEDAYAMQLFPMEGNALKIYRSNPKANSRRIREAVALTLFDIKSRLEGKVYDTGRFRDENNAELENALLMAFDPFTNEEKFIAQLNDIALLSACPNFTQNQYCISTGRENTRQFPYKIQNNYC